MRIFNCGRLGPTIVVASVLLLASTVGAARASTDYENDLPAAQTGLAAEAADVKFPVPAALREEHAQLHAELETLVRAGGATAKAAQSVAAELEPHFIKEEKYALPPLALLPALARGEVTSNMYAVLPLTVILKRDLPQMLAEHAQILAVLQRLERAAIAERKPEAERFARELMRHAQIEEQVTYPAAILVGEYLQLRRARPQQLHNADRPATGERGI